MTNRTTTDVINDAIKENSKGALFLYFLTFCFVVVGLGVIIHSATNGSIGEGFIGAVASALCYPPLNMARTIRQENITLRTLEVPLNNATTADGAAEMLSLLMESVFKREAK